MIPWIYSPINNLEFRSTSMGEAYLIGAGLGRLPDCISSTTTISVSDGVYETKIVYPLNGTNYDLIKDGYVLVNAADVLHDREPFIIYRRELNLDDTATIYAHHVSYALRYIVIPPGTVASMSDLLTLLHSGYVGASSNTGDLYDGSNFTYIYDGDFDFSSPFVIDRFMTAQEVIGRLIQEEGFRVKYEGFVVTFIYDEVETDDIPTIYYSGTLTNATQEYETRDAYNAVVPYWVNSETGAPFPSAAADIRIVKPTQSSDYVYPGGYKRRIQPLDLSGEFDSQPTVTNLVDAANEHLNNSTPWVPFETLTVNFVPYEIDNDQAVNQTDTVCVYDRVRVVIQPMETDVIVRVIKTEYDALLERYISMDVGQPQVTLSDVYGSGATYTSESGGGGGGGQQTFDNPVQFNNNVAVHAGGLLNVVNINVPWSVSSGDAAKTTNVSASTVQSEIGSGWTALGVVGWNSGNGQWYVRACYLNNGAITFATTRRDSTASSAASYNGSVHVLCVRTSL